MGKERETVRDIKYVEFREDVNTPVMISEYSNFTNIKQEVKGNM